MRELDLSEKPVVTALNKIDLLSRRDGESVRGLEELREHRLALRYDRPDALLISAQGGWGLDELCERIAVVMEHGTAVSGSASSRWSVKEKQLRG